MTTSRPCCFRVHARDNVATLLAAAEAGTLEVLGEGEERTVTLAGPLRQGHKVALVPLAAGDPVVKYGVVIGLATAAIERGRHVHLHNCRSVFDARSSTLDLDDGTPSDMPYE